MRKKNTLSQAIYNFGNSKSTSTMWPSWSKAVSGYPNMEKEYKKPRDQQVVKSSEKHAAFPLSSPLFPFSPSSHPSFHPLSTQMIFSQIKALVRKGASSNLVIVTHFIFAFQRRGGRRRGSRGDEGGGGGGGGRGGRTTATAAACFFFFFSFAPIDAPPTSEPGTIASPPTPRFVSSSIKDLPLDGSDGREKPSFEGPRRD